MRPHSKIEPVQKALGGSSATDRGQQGQFAPGPQCEGSPNQCWTLSRFIISSQSRGPFRCIIDFKSACIFASRFCCWRKLQKCTLYLMWLQRSRWLGPRTSHFSIWNRSTKTATCRYVCAVCMLEMEPQKPPEHTSEHVKSQNFLGVCPQPPLTQSIVCAPLL